MYQILLIDDDFFERDLVKDICDKTLSSKFQLHYVKDMPDALRLLGRIKFDLILLDNILSTFTNAKNSVPLIKEKSQEAPIAVISNDVSASYLAHPSIVGVDHIVEKSKLPAFLKLFQSLY